MIYHITTPGEYSKFETKNYFRPLSLDSDGFVHCSTLKQYKATIERYFSEVQEIIILQIDEGKLKSTLKYELSKTGEKFPHIYGGINREAIIEAKKYSQWRGSFDL